MRFDETKNALEHYSDPPRFEELCSRLLSQIDPRIRPLGGSGDRARDAVGGLYRLGAGEELVVMYSTKKRWSDKISAELVRIREFGWQPTQIVAVTNRPVGRLKERALQGEAEGNGWALTIFDQRWLATRLHLRDNLDLRTEYLGLPRPEPDFFMLAHDYRDLLEKRNQLQASFVARDRELHAALGHLDVSGADVLVEGDGGIGKTCFTYEMSRRDQRGRRWFFAPEGLPFQPARLGELESGDQVVVVIDDAHLRPDLRGLLTGLERRIPRPQLVLTVRRGFEVIVERARRGTAFNRPETIRLLPLWRRDIVALLQQPPFELRHEGTLLSIVQLSGGNPQIAIIAGHVAASGTAPHDLHSGNVFRDYVESLLDSAAAAEPEARELLALVASVRAICLTWPHDVAAVTDLTGIAAADVRRRLGALADAGLVVEESGEMFTIKPDLLSEEILRYSFFDEHRRPVLRYTTVYQAFAALRRIDLLRVLSAARVSSDSATEEALRMIRSDLLTALPVAQHRSLPDYAHFASATAGMPDISLDLADALMTRLPATPGTEFEAIASELVTAVSRAKFGDFPRGFRTLLRLGGLLFADGRAGKAAQEALQAELSEIYSACPVDYSDDDGRTLAGVQAAICDEIGKFWRSGEMSQPGIMTAAFAARALLALVYEHQRPAADDAMSLRIYAVGIPATPQTRTTLALGARLFRETFLHLPAELQLQQLESLREIASVAAGGISLCGYQPGKDVQALAEEILSSMIEPWLRESLPAMQLPVAAEVLSYFQLRPPSARPSRVRARLREYLDLIHPSARFMRPRWSWATEQKAISQHGKKYASRLLAAGDPLKSIDRWNAWLEEASVTGDESPWRPALVITLSEAAKRNADCGILIARHIYETNLRIAEYGSGMLAAMAATPAGRDLISLWLGRPEANLRRAAATIAANLDEDESRPVLAQLARDGEPSVRRAVWDALCGLQGRLSSWKLDIVLQLLRQTPADGRLEFLLVRLVHQAKQSEEQVCLTDSQRKTISELVLATAQAERVPHHSVSILLEQANLLSLDLVGDWLWCRLDYLQRAPRGIHMHDLPDDLGPMIKARHKVLGSKETLVHLFTLYENKGLPWPARQAVEKAVDWLAGDTAELTAQITKWSSQPDGLPRALIFLARTEQWELFTERARALLQAHPDEAQLRAAIINVRRPMSFWGSGELHYRAESEHFARWLVDDDAVLSALGREAVDHYNALADQAAAAEELERQS